MRRQGQGRASVPSVARRAALLAVFAGLVIIHGAGTRPALATGPGEWAGAADRQVSRARTEGAQATFRSGVDAVRLDVLVIDGGRPVAGLTAEDFDVLDEGVPQKVELAATAAGVTVLPVFDTSGSMAGSRLRELRGAADDLFDGLRIGDRAGLITFSERLVVQAPLHTIENGTEDMKRALGGARAWGRTALYDAIYAGLCMPSGAGGRALLLVFSDGADTASWLRADAVLEAAKRSDVVVYVVSTGVTRSRTYGFTSSEGASVKQSSQGAPTRGTPVWDERQSFLAALAAASGGQVFQVDETGRLKGRLAAILGEFRARYLLSYTPQGVRTDDGWHKLTVRLKSKKGSVKARSGYYARSGR